MQAVEHEPEWEAFQREATACHEAGHAVAHYVLRLPFESVTIVANLVYAGCVTLAPDDRAQVVAIIDRDEAIPLSQTDRELLWRHLITLYAGGMAQIKAERDVWGSVGDSNDRYRTVELVVTLDPETPEWAEQAGAE